MAAYDEFMGNYNRSINSGMLLDVSALKSDGTGSQIVPTLTGKKNIIAPLSVISDNYHAYYLAMHILGQEFAPYTAEYLRLHGYGQGLGADLLHLLDQRARNLELDNVVDVSEMKYNEITGYELTTYPTGESDRKWIEPMPIISNNYARYVKAISLLPLEYGTYSDHFVIEYGSLDDFNVAMTLAARKGNISMVRLMLDKGANVFDYTMAHAAFGGHMDIINLMMEKGVKDYNRSMVMAAKGGHIDIVRLMIQKGATKFNDAMKSAAIAGHKDIVNLMTEKGANQFDMAMRFATVGGHIGIVRSMIDKGATSFNRAMDFAAKGGHMDIVNLMIEKGSTDFNKSMASAAGKGHIDIVRLMIEKGATDFYKAIGPAIYEGHEEIVQLLKSYAKP